MRIGDLAKRAGVTTRTVRYYEGLGLLKTQERSFGGQRTYTDKDLLYLQRVLQLKNYGFQLDEIGKIIKMGRTDVTGEAQRVELLKQYRALVSDNKRKIEALESLNAELGWHVTQLENAGQGSNGFKDCPGASCKGCQFADRCDLAIKEE
jgi:DNA-binding transcriptional MerR regulator